MIFNFFPGTNNRQYDFDCDPDLSLDLGTCKGFFYHCKYKQYWTFLFMVEVCTL